MSKKISWALFLGSIFLLLITISPHNTAMAVGNNWNCEGYEGVHCPSCDSHENDLCTYDYFQQRVTDGSCIGAYGISTNNGGDTSHSGFCCDTDSAFGGGHIAGADLPFGFQQCCPAGTTPWEHKAIAGFATGETIGDCCPTNAGATMCGTAGHQICCQQGDQCVAGGTDTPCCAPGGPTSGTMCSQNLQAQPILEHWSYTNPQTQKGNPDEVGICQKIDVGDDNCWSTWHPGSITRCVPNDGSDKNMCAGGALTDNTQPANNTGSVDVGTNNFLASILLAPISNSLASQFVLANAVKYDHTTNVVAKWDNKVCVTPPGGTAGFDDVCNVTATCDQLIGNCKGKIAPPSPYCTGNDVANFYERCIGGDDPAKLVAAAQAGTHKFPKSTGAQFGGLPLPDPACYGSEDITQQCGCNPAGQVCTTDPITKQPAIANLEQCTQCAAAGGNAACVNVGIKVGAPLDCGFPQTVCIPGKVVDTCIQIGGCSISKAPFPGAAVETKCPIFNVQPCMSCGNHCNPGATQACAQGTKTCNANGTWGDCSGACTPNGNSGNTCPDGSAQQCSNGQLQPCNTCPTGQSNPHTVCNSDGSCTPAGGCGTSADCSKCCPTGQSNPHQECQADGTTKTVNTCGVTQTNCGCTPGATKTCTCGNTITCQADGTWPQCPATHSECVKDANGNTCQCVNGAGDDSCKSLGATCSCCTPGETDKCPCGGTKTCTLVNGNYQFTQCSSHLDSQGGVCKCDPTPGTDSCQLGKPSSCTQAGLTQNCPAGGVQTCAWQNNNGSGLELAWTACPAPYCPTSNPPQTFACSNQGKCVASFQSDGSGCTAAGNTCTPPTKLSCSRQGQCVLTYTSDGSGCKNVNDLCTAPPPYTSCVLGKCIATYVSDGSGCVAGNTCPQSDNYANCVLDSGTYKCEPAPAPDNSPCTVATIGDSCLPPNILSCGSGNKCVKTYVADFSGCQNVGDKCCTDSQIKCGTSCCNPNQTCNSSTNTCVDNPSSCAPLQVACGSVFCNNGQTCNSLTSACSGGSGVCSSSQVTCGTGCCSIGQTCNSANNSCACGSGSCSATAVKCGSACCSSGQTCNSATNTCSGGTNVCTGSQVTCGNGCCNAGETCNSPFNTCSGGSGSCTSLQVKCGTACCSSSQTCNSATSTCSGGTGSCTYSQVVCGNGCCSAGQICNSPFNTCTTSQTCTSSQVTCGTSCCSSGQTCNSSTSTCTGGSSCSSSQVQCGTACCSSSQTCNSSTSTCSGGGGLCTGSQVACGSACCAQGQICNSATDTCSGGSGSCTSSQVKCGTACCSSGQSCNSATNTCTSGSGTCSSSQITCGTACCNSGSVCNSTTNTCTSGGSCSSSQVACGSSCCSSGQVCDSTTGTCSAGLGTCTSSQVACGSGCCSAGQTCNTTTNTCSGSSAACDPVTKTCIFGGTGPSCDPTNSNCNSIPTCGLDVNGNPKCMVGGGGNYCTGDGQCAKNQPPYVYNLSANPYNYCDNLLGIPQSGSLTLSWQYGDKENDPEQYSQLQIATDSAFNNLILNQKILGNINSKFLSVYSGLLNPTSSCAPNCSYVNYGEAYYWRVKVLEKSTAAVTDSGYVNYIDSHLATNYDPNGYPTKADDLDGNKSTYTYPYLHPAPQISYNVVEPSPQPAKVADFTDSSTCYTTTGQYLCADTSVSTATYQWWLNIPAKQSQSIVQYMNSTTPTSTTVGSASYIYPSAGNYSTALKICDDIGCCYAPASIPVGTNNASKIPSWQEISPF